MGLNAKGIAVVFPVWAAIFSFACFICAKLFEYSLWSITGKDVPWYWDLAGGLALNGGNLPIAILCCICRACGIEAPFYEI